MAADCRGARSDQPEAYFKLGAVLLLSNRAQEAVAPLETAVRLNSRDAAAHRNLALAYANCGRFVEARVQLEQAISLDPNDLQARALLKSLPSTARR